MSLRTVLKRGLCSTGISSALARRDGSSFILAAHIVLEEEAQPLADVIRLLRRRFSLVSIDEYLAALRTGACRNLVTLTFDDGLRNQLTIAHQVLSSLRVPATFYVCPALVGTPYSTWTCELEPRLARLSSPRRYQIFARGSADSFPTFLEGLKTMPLGRRDALWDEIVSATPGFAFTPDEERQFAPMDWAELANGSHDHRASRAVARHFESGVTMDQRAVGPASSPHLLPCVHIQWNLPELVWTLARVARG
jgi:peptidoglycan/xylan/chitin deacetylase (PgdA/CDA1 family)